MITGFNTDIQHGGVTYHVQTEDKGVETPLILSLVYVGGAIIASKRSLYQDLIESGFDEKTLTERLQRQHKLICAAIKAGRVEDLKRMGAREETPRRESSSREAPLQTEAEPAVLTGEEQFLVQSYQSEAAPDAFGAKKIEIEELAVENTAQLPLPPSPPAEVQEPEVTDATEFIEVSETDEIYLSLLEDEGEFRAGQLATIKIRAGRGPFGQRPIADAAVTIKVLGTTFRPLILSTKTGNDGVAIVRALLPRFTSGRAAIIIRASFGDDFSEMRRIIHQA